jgi:hypothetical protein
MPKARSVGGRSEIFIAFRPNNCDQLRRSGIKPFSRGWKMYRSTVGIFLAATVALVMLLLVMSV